MLTIDFVTVDCRNPMLLAEFWCEMLDWEVGGQDDESAWIQPRNKDLVVSPRILFYKNPDTKLVKVTEGGPEQVSAADYFKGRKVALFSVPGAFMPTCSAKHLPGFVQNADALKGKGVDIEFVKPETGAVAFFTTLHLAKGTAEVDNAYKYMDVVASKEVQEALTKPPFNFIPVNKDVPMPPDLPMKSLDEFGTYVRHDWSKINPLRAGWIEKFNKEMAK